MQRKDFLNLIGSASALATMSGFVSNAFAQFSSQTPSPNSSDFARFGAVHLNNTSLAKATDFWTNIVGLRIRRADSQTTEFGTEAETLVVVHQSAQRPFQEGYSGLYHVALHAPNKHEFAKMLYRIMVHRYPFSPVDHTMSKSAYLVDADGVQIEIALETPERFKRLLVQGGLRIEGTDGVLRSGSASLDVNEVLNDLSDRDLSKPVSEGTKIGHIHFYCQDLSRTNEFYRQLGFPQFNYLPNFAYCDCGTGGPYQHRIAMNSWHGHNKPTAPHDNAGLRHFHIIFETKEKLREALQHQRDFQESVEGFWLADPSGNRVLMS